MSRRRLKALGALLLALSLGLGVTLHGAQASEMAVAMTGDAEFGAPVSCVGSADAHDMDEIACAAMCMIAGAAVLPTDFLVAPVPRAAPPDGACSILVAVPTPPDPFPPRPTSET